MAARDVADGIGHGQHGQAEGERDAEQADADLGKARGDDGAAAAGEGEPEGADRFGRTFTQIHDLVLLHMAAAEPAREYRSGADLASVPADPALKPQGCAKPACRTIGETPERHRRKSWSILRKSASRHGSTILLRMA